MSGAERRLRRLAPGERITMGRSDVPPTDERAFDFVSHAAMRDGWLHPAASNYTFVVELAHHGAYGYGVYKPERGENPLRDFPAGLFRRECAAYELSLLLGWSVVPPTVVRDDGEFGVGSLQLFVPPMANSHYFALRDDWPDDALRLAVFDLVANNADRKAGHCFIAEASGLWAIDNGLTFHEEYKLRTVIWDFADQPVPDLLLADVDRLRVLLGERAHEGVRRLAELLEPAEMEALERRACAVLEHPLMPGPTNRRDLPWPWM
jgi:hypothetical protein